MLRGHRGVLSAVRLVALPEPDPLTEAAEPLMVPHDRRIDPASQPEVRAVLGRLTAAALSELRHRLPRPGAATFQLQRPTGRLFDLLGHCLLYTSDAADE